MSGTPKVWRASLMPGTFTDGGSYWTKPAQGNATETGAAAAVQSPGKCPSLLVLAALP